EIPKHMPDIPGLEDQVFDMNSLMGMGSDDGPVLPDVPPELLDSPRAQEMFGQVEQAVKLGFADGIQHLMTVSFFIMVAGTLVILFIPALPLRKTVAADEQPAETPGAAAAD